MNPSKLFLSLIIVLQLFTCPLIGQSIDQTFIITTYIVEYTLISKDGGAYTPMHQRTISLYGKPEPNSEIEHITLFFTEDEKLTSTKPVYDTTKQKATAWYPMEAFQDYLEMLKHRKGKLKCVYHHSSKLQETQLYFVTNGLLPMK